MVFLTQRKQLALAVESVEGTPETITSADLVTVLNPSATINLNNIRRPVLRGSFSKVTSGTGIQDGELSFDQEFSGPADGAAATASPLDPTLRACGFRSVDLYAVKINSFTPAHSADPDVRVVVGDVLVGDTTGGTVRVMATNSNRQVQDQFLGGDNTTHGRYLLFEDIDSTIDATDTELTPLNSGLTAGFSHDGKEPVIGLSAQTPVRVGTAWVPVSTTTQTIDITVTQGTFAVGQIIFQPLDVATTSAALEIAYGRIVATDSSTYIEYEPLDGSGHSFENAGAGSVEAIVPSGTVPKGTVDSDPSPSQGPTITGKIFEDGIAKTFAGCRGASVLNFPTGEFPILSATFQGAYNAVGDEANFAAGSAAQAEVPTLLGYELRINDVWIPCAQSISIDVGQNLVRRTCGGNASGLEGFAITDRVPTITMDPETVAEAVSAAAYADAKAATTFTFQFRFGDLSVSTGTDSWVISADQCQYESLNSGDRDGIITSDGTMQVNSYSTLNDYEIAICNYNQSVLPA